MSRSAHYVLSEWETTGFFGSHKREHARRIVYQVLVLVQLLRSFFKKIFGYRTKIQALEPYFQTSATRSAPNEDTASDVALAHSRECTSAPMSSYLPCHFLARSERSELEQKNKMSSGKRTGSNMVPVSLAVWSFSFANQGRSYRGQNKRRNKTK